VFDTAEGNIKQAYTDFSLEALKQQFGLHVQEESVLFVTIAPVTVSDLLH
jgi:hypothetical protein